MKALEFEGYVHDGELVIEDPYYLNKLKKLEGKKISGTVRKFVKKRTTSQTGYLFGVVYVYALEGFRSYGNEFDINDMHEFFKDKFLARREILINLEGDVEMVPASTKNLNTVEFGEYIEKIRVWLAETMFITVPDPIKKAS